MTKQILKVAPQFQSVVLSSLIIYFHHSVPASFFEAAVSILLLASSEALAQILSIAAFFDGERYPACDDKAPEVEPILTRSTVVGDYGHLLLCFDKSLLGRCLKFDTAATAVKIRHNVFHQTPCDASMSFD
jgi:hypothetical protein